MRRSASGRRLSERGTCPVTGYEPLIGSLALTDEGDRHVLAAAIAGRCDVIVTQNLRDFPAAVLTSFGIEAQHPDDFCCNHLNLAPGVFCDAVRRCVRGSPIRRTRSTPIWRR